MTLNLVPKGGYHNEEAPVSVSAATSGDRVAGAASDSHQVGSLTSGEVIDQIVPHQTEGLQAIDQAVSRQTGGLPLDKQINPISTHHARGLHSEQGITQAIFHQPGGLPPEERVDQIIPHQPGGLLPGKSVEASLHPVHNIPIEERRVDQTGNSSAATTGSTAGHKISSAVIEEKMQDCGSDMELESSCGSHMEVDSSCDAPPIEGQVVDFSEIGGGGPATGKEVRDVTMEDHTQHGVGPDQPFGSGAEDQTSRTCAAAANDPPDVDMVEMNQNGGSPSVELGPFISPAEDQAVDSAATTKETPDIVMEDAEIQSHGTTSVGHDQTRDAVAGSGVVGSISQTKDSDGSDIIVPTRGKGKGKGKGKDKDSVDKTKKGGPAHSAVSMTLVHGDSLVLTGDDYEVCIPLMVTSFDI